ncbi:MAG: hypothetical protein QOC84_1660 [Bradyrhizobium sp.]|nr:hypothetical protein [Bradyrhizobium sp.]
MIKKNEKHDDDYRDDNFRFGDDDDHRLDTDHKRDDGNDDHYIHRDGELIAAAQDPAHPHQMYFGAGNFATGYEIADNFKEHIELGLKVHVRQGPDSPCCYRPS